MNFLFTQAHMDFGQAQRPGMPPFYCVLHTTLRIFHQLYSPPPPSAPLAHSCCRCAATRSLRGGGQGGWIYLLVLVQRVDCELGRKFPTYRMQYPRCVLQCHPNAPKKTTQTPSPIACVCV